MNLTKTPVQNKHKPKKSYYQTQYKKILRIEKSKSKSWRIPHVVFPALSARLGDGCRYSRRWRAIGSWRRRSRRLRQSRGWDRWRGVDDGILAAIVSSPVDCFYQLSEMASICSGGGERRRWHVMACVVTDWRKTGSRGDGMRRWWLENDEIKMTFFPQMMKSVLQLVVALFPPNDEISSSIGDFAEEERHRLESGGWGTQFGPSTIKMTFLPLFITANGWQL
nr:hypothetical protein Iba_chr08dCG14140 [Ipomoea batatas]